MVLNDEINATREATKTDALRLNTFQTRGVLLVLALTRTAGPAEIQRMFAEY